MSWRRRVKTGLHQTLARTERVVDSAAHRARLRFGRYDPAIVPYRGFGGPGGTRVWGRVMNDIGTRPSADGDRWWHNTKAMFRRFATVEVPEVEVEVRFAGETHFGVTDDEGYFTLDLPPAPGELSGWLTAEVRIADADRERYGGAEAEARVLLPGPHAEFGVISDIDDTVLRSGATRTWDLIKTTVLGNARTRMPFEGVATFYTALTAGRAGAADNPIYYVSSSPWNLYDFLVEFMEVHGLPDGPILLRDLGIDENRFIKGSHEDHKLTQIEAVLAATPKLPFVLVGDSGQRDPEIYAEVAARHGDRIRAIYIRDVGLEGRQAEVVTIAGQLGETIPMLLVADTATAVRHAAAIGLVN